MNYEVVAALLVGLFLGALMDMFIAQTLLAEKLGLDHPLFSWWQAHKNRQEVVEPIIPTDTLERLREIHVEGALGSAAMLDIIDSHLALNKKANR